MFQSIYYITKDSPIKPYHHLTIEDRIKINTLVNIKDAANRIKVESRVTTNKNGFELRRSIGIISSRIGMRYDRTN